MKTDLSTPPEVDTFQRFFALAEFGAQRHEDRRTVEFRVFISYVTLLAFAFYHFTKSRQLFGVPFPDPWDEKCWLALPFILVHWVYCYWERGLAIAMANDADRRNFFLAKAECLADWGFTPPFRRKIRPRGTNGTSYVSKGENVCEKELFEKAYPLNRVILQDPCKELYKYWERLWADWSRPLHIIIPTILIVTLFAHKFCVYKAVLFSVFLSVPILWGLIRILWEMWRNRPSASRMFRSQASHTEQGTKPPRHV